MHRQCGEHCGGERDTRVNGDCGGEPVDERGVMGEGETASKCRVAAKGSEDGAHDCDPKRQPRRTERTKDTSDRAVAP